MIMSEELKLKFLEEMADVDWPALKKHYERDALIIISQNLDLVEMAIMTAKDDSEQMADLIATAKITKPSEEQVKTWENNPEKKFQFLIVQPFVLAQEIFN